MKKSLFLLFASFSFIAANSQNLTSKKGEAYLPEKGDWAISVNADGIFRWVGNIANNTSNNAAPSVSEVLDATFVGKRFTSDKTAIRYIAGVVISNSTETAEAAGNTNKLSETNFGLTAGIGKEWRRGKTRLQGYYGADALLQISSSSEKETNSKSGVGLKELKSTSGLGLGIGANGFIGAEYFLFPKMAIGAQYEAGFIVSLEGAGKTTATPWSGSATETKGSSVTTIGVGPVGVASIRLTLHF